MSLCPSCGLEVTSGELCPHHPAGFSDDWSAGNRIVCDFFHRGKVPVRLPPTERGDEYGYGSAGDAA